MVIFYNQNIISLFLTKILFGSQEWIHYCWQLFFQLNKIYYTIESVWENWLNKQVWNCTWNMANDVYVLILTNFEIKEWRREMKNKTYKGLNRTELLVTLTVNCNVGLNVNKWSTTFYIMLSIVYSNYATQSCKFKSYSFELY